MALNRPASVRWLRVLRGALFSLYEVVLLRPVSGMQRLVFIGMDVVNADGAFGPAKPQRED